MTMPKAHAFKCGPLPEHSTGIFPVRSDDLRRRSSSGHVGCKPSVQLQLKFLKHVAAAIRVHVLTRPGDSQRDASSDVEAASEHSR